MKHHHFLSQVDDDKLLAAIRAAERKTSGEIRVFVSHHLITDALAGAEKQFRHLGMHKNKRRNGVLIFIVPKSQSFAIYGDAAVHAKCGPEFWQALRDEMTGHLKAGEFMTALLHAVNRAGDLLAVHFPAEANGGGRAVGPIEFE